MIYTATVTSQGQITIPAELRRRYFKPGSTIILEESLYGGGPEVKLRPSVSLSEAIGVANKYTTQSGATLDEALAAGQEAARKRAAQDDQRVVTQYGYSAVPD